MLNNGWGFGKKIKKQLRECRTEDSTLRRQQSGPRHCQQHVSKLLPYFHSQSRLPEVRGHGLDLVAPSRTFMSLGNGLGFIQQEARLMQHYVSLSSGRLCPHAGQTNQHSILFTRLQSHNQYTQQPTLSIWACLMWGGGKKIKSGPHS